MFVQSPFAALLDALPVREESVTVLGSTTRYWVYGSDDAEVTVVITHGYRGEHHGLEPVIGHIRGVRFISPDLPGFGESTPLTEVDHSIAGYAAWLGAFMDALDLNGTAVVLGHSFGTIVSSFAIARGIVSAPKLILINPIAAPATSGPNAILTHLTVLFYRFSLVLPERVGRLLLDNWFVVRLMSMSMMKTKDKALRRWINDQHHTYFGNFANRKTVVEAFNASVSTDVSDVGSEITMPTLLIGAELDLITPVSALYALQKQMPNATLHVIPDVGHLIHYEKSRIAAEHMVEFLGTGQVVPSDES